VDIRSAPRSNHLATLLSQSFSSAASCECGRFLHSVLTLSSGDTAIFHAPARTACRTAARIDCGNLRMSCVKVSGVALMLDISRRICSNRLPDCELIGRRCYPGMVIEVPEELRKLET
jgi:hypothetical protein